MMKPISLHKITYYCWLLTVFSSFWQTTDLALTIPIVGQLFIFRFFLPVTVCLFIADCIVKHRYPLRHLTSIQKCFMLVIGVFVVYGAISLLWCIDFLTSFKAWFNLSLSLTFAVLAILFVDNKQKLKGTLAVLFASCISVLTIGLIDVFFTPVFYTPYALPRTYYFLGSSPLGCPFGAFYNTNDFVMALLYTLPAVMIFLWFNVKLDTFRHRYSPLLIAIFCILYFLIRCASANLGELAFWSLFICLFIWMLLLQRKLAGVFFCVLAFILLVHVGEMCSARFDNDNEQANNAEQIEEIKGIDKYFFAIDEESGKKVLDTNSAIHSGGVRVALIEFAFESFKNTKGLGVGIGNIEVLALREPKERLNGLSNIHNAPVKLLAELGFIILFPLIPTIILILISLTRIVIKLHKQKKYGALLNYGALMSGIVAFPLLSTMSSGGTDSLQMWMFVALVVLMTGSKPIVNVFVNEGSAKP